MNDFDIFLQTAMTDERADMSLLRIIRESELRLGEVIGSGAFGTVYSVSHQRAPANDVYVTENNRLINNQLI